jgi:hypothetical protein
MAQGLDGCERFRNVPRRRREPKLEDHRQAEDPTLIAHVPLTKPCGGQILLGLIDDLCRASDNGLAFRMTLQKTPLLRYTVAKWMLFPLSASLPLFSSSLD